jgi:hypothetical protein
MCYRGQDRHCLGIFVYTFFFKIKRNIIRLYRTARSYVTEDSTPQTLSGFEVLSTNVCSHICIESTLHNATMTFQSCLRALDYVKIICKMYPSNQTLTLPSLESSNYEEKTGTMKFWETCEAFRVVSSKTASKLVHCRRETLSCS